ncbi:MAG: hypothetical protein UD961_15885 [Bacteroidales bacterium]|nr:hypothetical protein [Bacteroidales bacterium]
MINFKKIIMPSLLGVVAAATLGDSMSLFENIPFLEGLCDFFAFGSGASLAVVTAGIVGAGEKGASVDSDNPAGTTVVSTDGEGNAANYLDDDLNPVLVKIRPQDTPIDTITRMIGNTEKSEAWEAGGWEIGTREVSDTLAEAVTANATTVKVTTPDMWLVGDTFVLVNDKGPVLDGSNKPISCLVTAKTGNTLSVQRVGASASTAMPAVTIASGATVSALRLSRAVSELTASVTGFAIQPTDRKYFNQTHMCQVEESVIHAIHKKKVAMDFSTYKEQTLWDFKRGMEFANLFQVGGLSKDDNGELVHLATGLWWQMSEQSTIDFSKAMSDDDWNALGKDIFEGNNGSDRRFLLAGPELMLHISKVPAYSKQLEAKNTEMVLGVRVYKIETPFGELLVKPMGTLFDGYFSKCGIVLDVNYLKKYVMEPLTATVLELDKTGQRRVKNAVRMHETYSLFLENLPVHRRIVPKA